MTRTRKVAQALLLVVLVSSVLLAFVSSDRSGAIFLGAPALIITGLVVLGHFVTLDDDFPGGWSNPDGSKKHFYRSLLWLLGEVTCFVVALLAVFWR